MDQSNRVCVPRSVLVDRVYGINVVLICRQLILLPVPRLTSGCEFLSPVLSVLVRTVLSRFLYHVRVSPCRSPAGVSIPNVVASFVFDVISNFCAYRRQHAYNEGFPVLIDGPCRCLCRQYKGNISIVLSCHQSFPLRCRGARLLTWMFAMLLSPFFSPFVC